MQVQYKDGFTHTFDFMAGDEVAVLLDTMHFLGQITDVEPDGFWVVIEGEPGQEELFTFVDVRAVIARSSYTENRDWIVKMEADRGGGNG